MGALILPQRLQQQPQQATQIDWSNPITRGLVFAAIPGGPELISGTMPVKVGAATVGANERGRTFSTASATTDGWGWPIPANHPLYSITDEDSIFVLARRASTGSAIFGAPYKASTWAAPYYAWGMVGGAGPATYHFAYSGSTTRRTVSSAAGFFVNGELHGYGSSRKAGSVQFVKDGVQHSTGTIATNPVDWGERGSPTLFTRSAPSPGEGTVGQAGLVLAFKRELSPAEWASLAQNPWQVFKAPARRIWASVAIDPAGAISGTFAASEIADSLAAAGAASFAPVTGSSSSNEAADSLLASGSANLAAISGTASSAEGGDTLAAAGGATFSPVTGTAAASESPDVAASVGMVLSAITGSMQASEAPDTLAAGSMRPAPEGSGGGGGAGSVREVRAFADELDRARKPTKGEKKRRKQAIEAAVLELLPDEPAAERVAPVLAQIVARELPPATWAPVHGPRPVILPPAVVADVRARVAEWLAHQQLLAELEDEFETELLLLG